MAGVSTANLAGNLTAMSIQYGLIFALETLTSQAMGGHRHHEVGLLMQRALVCCAIALIPGYALWAVMEDLLIALHQPPDVAALAARFLRIYSPGLPGLVLFELSRRFLGCASTRRSRGGAPSARPRAESARGRARPRSHVIRPLHARARSCQDIVLAYIPITVLATWVCHPLLLNFLMTHGFGFDSVPIASAFTAWALALLALAYIAIGRPHDARTWAGVEVRHALTRHGMAHFLRIAVPGVFTMTEWWFWEVVCACVGALGEEQLASHLIAYSIVPLLVMAPVGISIAIAVRVGQLIGEGRARAAKLVAGGAFAAAVATIGAYTLAVALSSRRIIGAFSNAQTSAEVIGATREIWPLVTAFLVLDGIYMTLMGVVRALAFQLRASVCVFVALWLVGLPTTFYVAYGTRAGLRGVWAALLPVYALLNVLCALIVLYADWNRVSSEVTEEAREEDALDEEQLAAERAAASAAALAAASPPRSAPPGAPPCRAWRSRSRGEPSSAASA